MINNVNNKVDEINKINHSDLNGINLN